MKQIRRKYKGWIIDRDNLGRLYVYNPASPYTEDFDRVLVKGSSLKAAKEEINWRIQWAKDFEALMAEV